LLAEHTVLKHPPYNILQQSNRPRPSVCLTNGIVKNFSAERNHIINTSPKPKTDRHTHTHTHTHGSVQNNIRAWTVHGSSNSDRRLDVIAESNSIQYKTQAHTSTASCITFSDVMCCFKYTYWFYLNARQFRYTTTPQKQNTSAKGKCTYPTEEDLPNKCLSRKNILQLIHEMCESAFTNHCHSVHLHCLHCIAIIFVVQLMDIIAVWSIDTAFSPSFFSAGLWYEL
jgi:hypothetical protein